MGDRSVKSERLSGKKVLSNAAPGATGGHWRLIHYDGGAILAQTRRCYHQQSFTTLSRPRSCLVRCSCKSSPRLGICFTVPPVAERSPRSTVLRWPFFFPLQDVRGYRLRGCGGIGRSAASQRTSRSRGAGGAGGGGPTAWTDRVGQCRWDFALVGATNYGSHHGSFAARCS